MNMPLATPKPRPTTSAMIASIAAEGQRVFVAVTVQFGGVAEKIARLSQQIETDIGQCEVNFQFWRVTTPGSQTLREHQTVVAQTQDVCR